MTLVHSVDCYTEEIPDYGIEEYVESWAEAGVTRLRPTLAYHVCRVLSPANPRRRLLDLEGDVCFLDQSSATHFDGPLKPRFTERSRGVLEQVAQAASERGVGLDGWTVFLNNWELATKHPECAVQSPFGSPDMTWLSPSHPAVVDYCVGLVRAAGKSGLFDTLQCEAVYHVPFPAHPVDRVNISGTLSELDLWLGGVCTSEHSLRLINESGGDGRRVEVRLREHLERRLRGTDEARPKTLEAVHDLLGADAEPLLAGRTSAITRLAQAMAAEAKRHGLRLEWEEDLSSWESFFSGIQEGPLSSERQWEVGVDRGAIAGLMDEVGLLLYFRDLDRFRAELIDATQTFGKVPRVLQRPFPPDVTDAEALGARLGILIEHGVPESVYYMQSLMLHDTQEIVSAAVAAGTSVREE